MEWSDQFREREREKGERDKQLPAVNKEIQKGYLGFFSISFLKATVKRRKVKSLKLYFWEIGCAGMP